MHLSIAALWFCGALQTYFAFHSKNFNTDITEPQKLEIQRESNRLFFDEADEPKVEYPFQGLDIYEVCRTAFVKCADVVLVRVRVRVRVCTSDVLGDALLCVPCACERASVTGGPGTQYIVLGGQQLVDQLQLHVCRFRNVHFRAFWMMNATQRMLGCGRQ